jgi:hypothetical protein
VGEGEWDYDLLPFSFAWYNKQKENHMAKGRVVNVHVAGMVPNNQWYEYIGRPAKNSIDFEWGTHWGNPYTHRKTNTLASVQVETAKEAVESYRLWLEEKIDLQLEPERRQWILDHVHELHGKTLGCYCVPGPCHGTVLVEFAERKAAERRMK